MSEILRRWHYEIYMIRNRIGVCLKIKTSTKHRNISSSYMNLYEHSHEKLRRSNKDKRLKRNMKEQLREKTWLRKKNVGYLKKLILTNHLI